MTTLLYDEFNSCGEVRLMVGTGKYKLLTNAEIRDVLNAFECREKLAAMTIWLEKNNPDVFRMGIWEAIK